MKQWIGCPTTNISMSNAGSHAHFTNFTVCLCRCVTTLTCLSARKHVLHSTCPSSLTSCLSSSTVKASSMHTTRPRTSKLYHTNTLKDTIALQKCDQIQSTGQVQLALVVKINCKFAVECNCFSADLCSSAWLLIWEKAFIPIIAIHTEFVWVGLGSDYCSKFTVLLLVPLNCVTQSFFQHPF